MDYALFALGFLAGMVFVAVLYSVRYLNSKNWLMDEETR